MLRMRARPKALSVSMRERVQALKVASDALFFRHTLGNHIGRNLRDLRQGESG
jgi:hypothetical protein